VLSRQKGATLFFIIATAALRSPRRRWPRVNFAEPVIFVPYFLFFLVVNGTDNLLTAGGTAALNCRDMTGTLFLCTTTLNRADARRRHLKRTSENYAIVLANLPAVPYVYGRWAGISNSSPAAPAGESNGPPVLISQFKRCALLVAAFLLGNAVLGWTALRLRLCFVPPCT